MASTTGKKSSAMVDFEAMVEQACREYGWDVNSVDKERDVLIYLKDGTSFGYGAARYVLRDDISYIEIKHPTDPRQRICVEPRRLQ